MKDITGQKFNRLTAIRFSEKRQYKSKKYSYFWLFRCDCGTEKVLPLSGVIYTDNAHTTKSCGCLHKITSRKNGLKSKTHGMSNTRFYHIFKSLCSRCLYPRNNRYSIYGKRGIKVLWKSFKEFKDDMHESYLDHVKEFGEKNTTIDRIDNNRNYCKENCRWATCKEQSRNRSTNHSITFQGKTMLQSDWADFLGISRPTFNCRLKKRGWSIKKAILIPIRIQYRNKLSKQDKI